MSDFKVGPGAGPRPPRIERPEPVEDPRGVAEGGVEGSEGATSVGGGAAAGAADPAALVERIRAGEIDVEGAVTEIIEGVLERNPALAASPSLRSDVRRALSELVENDPTLAALTSALKR